MPTSKDFSVEDEAYLVSIAAEPKMTMDEVGADIEEHGHVPVTKENMTQDPFTAKGSLANALDNCLSADTDLESTTMTRDNNDSTPDVNLPDPTDDRREESKGEIEGITDTPQNNYVPPPESEPTVQQDESVHVKDSLADALEAIAMDAQDRHQTENKEMVDYTEEIASYVPQKAPDVPESLGGDSDKPDENGLVYITRTFTVDPSEYVSNNYRPINNGGIQKDAAKMGKKPKGGKLAPKANPEEEAELSDLGTPEAKESAQEADEPTVKEEAAAAKEANKEQDKEEKKESLPLHEDKSAQDEAPEKVVLDYATFLDGSSFLCYDLSNGWDYSKVAMDTTPRRRPTRQNCQTTFAQCRAQNPLFCRFHGPKLLEADIKTAIRARLQLRGGFTVSVTRDRDAASPNTFRLTVGCAPAMKHNVEEIIDNFLRNNPGISSNDTRHETPRGNMTQEFEMDILRADEPPRRGDNQSKEAVALAARNKAVREGKTMEVVGETQPERPMRQRRLQRPSQVQAQQAQPEQTQEPQGQVATQTQTEQTSQQPTDRDVQRAAIELFNQNIEGDLGDAIGGINGVLNGTMQGLGNLSAEQNQADTARSYIDALSRAGGHESIVNALQGALDRLGGDVQREGATAGGERDGGPTEQEIEAAARFARHMMAGGRNLIEECMTGRGMEQTRPERQREICNAVIELLGRDPNNNHQAVINAIRQNLDRIGGEGAGNEPPQNETTRSAEQVNENANDGIEHLPGGVKARFSDSEKRAIEREMARAMAESNANPNDAQLRGYAHALSHFLGSRSSRYGQRNGALAGIRDDINKADLLAKAERRLAESADADNPARYEGTVRALNKIAEIAGLGGQIEIDGSTVRLAGQDNQQALEAARAEQSAENPQAGGRNENGGGGDNNPEAENAHREMLDADIREAANALYERNGYVNPAGWEADIQELLNPDIEYQDRQRTARETARAIRELGIECPTLLHDLDNIAGQQPAPQNQREAEETARNNAREEQITRLARAYNNANGHAGTEEEARNYIRRGLEGGLDSNQLQDLITTIEDIGAGDYQQIYDDLYARREGARAAEQRAAQTQETEQSTPSDNGGGNNQPTEEQIRDVAATVANRFGISPDAAIRELTSRLNGTHRISSSEIEQMGGMLSPDNPVVAGLTAVYERQQRAAEEARRREEEARQREAERRQNINISTYPQSYSPNPSMAAEEIQAKRDENNAFWNSGEGRSILGDDEGMNGVSGRTKMAKILAGLFQANQETVAEDEGLVQSLLPGVTRERNVDRYGILNGKFNPFVSNQSPGMNCYKGAYGLLLRMRGFKVTARSAFDPSANYAHSESGVLRGGDNTATYKAFQRAMSDSYEKVFGNREEVINKFREMAEGNPRKGIAPYPDGTFVMTWDGHARGNFLYKGKWFVVDPYGYDRSRTYNPGYTDAPFIKPITEEMMARHSRTTLAEDNNVTRVSSVINNLFDRRASSGDPRWNYASNDNNRQIVRQFADAARALQMTHFSLSGRGRGAGGRPSQEDIARCAEWLRVHGENQVLHGNVVVRPNEKLIPEGVGACEEAER